MSREVTLKASSSDGFYHDSPEFAGNGHFLLPGAGLSGLHYFFTTGAHLAEPTFPRVGGAMNTERV
jgi:hypothetical protein